MKIATVFVERNRFNAGSPMTLRERRHMRIANTSLWGGSLFFCCLVRNERVLRTRIARGMYKLCGYLKVVFTASLGRKCGSDCQRNCTSFSDLEHQPAHKSIQLCAHMDRPTQSHKIHDTVQAGAKWNNLVTFTDYKMRSNLGNTTISAVNT